MKSYRSDPVDNLSMQQTLLVRACLATTPAEREQYVRAWEEAVQILDLDFSASRLIPYFLHKNQQDGITCQHDKRLKVIYKHWWLRTHHISHQLTRVHAAFHAAGIDTVIIKGASIKHHYERPELRPMGDFDLLISKENLHEAMHVLRELDFIPNKLQLAYLEQVPDLLLDFTHAISWSHRSNDTYIDLHWRVGSRCSWQFTDKLWANLVPYAGLPDAKKPALAYELFMLLIHAMDSSNKDNLNWLIDVAVLQNQLDAAVWQAARQLAVDEKKADLFDYACRILLWFNVAAPDPGEVGVPKRLAATKPIGRGGLLRKTRDLPRMVSSLMYTIDRLYPHAGPLAKCYYFARRIMLFFVARRIRKEVGR
ncbi:nucleotidyltransferase family protein [Parapedobacter pyrenivorans]|uniref:nucleotidyltransferase family protein n=1 Tax=Parapedobacter pyrenivorans TaxID=1305674 RepID=UPI003340C610